MWAERRINTGEQKELYSQSRVTAIKILKGELVLDCKFSCRREDSSVDVFCKRIVVYVVDWVLWKWWRLQRVIKQSLPS